MRFKILLLAKRIGRKTLDAIQWWHCYILFGTIFLVCLIVMGSTIRCQSGEIDRLGKRVYTLEMAVHKMIGKETAAKVKLKEQPPARHAPTMSI